MAPLPKPPAGGHPTRTGGVHHALLLLLLGLSLIVLAACSVTLGAPAPTPGPGQPTNTPIEQVHFDITHVPSPTIAPPSPTAAGPIGSGGTVKYTIKPGDSLSGIAQQYGITVEDLVKLNNIADPNKIAAGQVILVPAPGSTPPPTSRPTPAPTRVP